MVIGRLYGRKSGQHQVDDYDDHHHHHPIEKHHVSPRLLDPEHIAARKREDHGIKRRTAITGAELVDNVIVKPVKWIADGAVSVLGFGWGGTQRVAYSAFGQSTDTNYHHDLQVQEPVLVVETSKNSNRIMVDHRDSMGFTSITTKSSTKGGAAGEVFDVVRGGLSGGKSALLKGVDHGRFGMHKFGQAGQRLLRLEKDADEKEKTKKDFKREALRRRQGERTLLHKASRQIFQSEHDAGLHHNFWMQLYHHWIIDFGGLILSMGVDRGWQGLTLLWLALPTTVLRRIFDYIRQYLKRLSKLIGLDRLPKTAIFSRAGKFARQEQERILEAKRVTQMRYAIFAGFGKTAYKTNQYCSKRHRRTQFKKAGLV